MCINGVSVWERGCANANDRCQGCVLRMGPRGTLSQGRGLAQIAQSRQDMMQSHTVRQGQDSGKWKDILSPMTVPEKSNNNNNSNSNNSERTVAYCVVMGPASSASIAAHARWDPRARDAAMRQCAATMTTSASRVWRRISAAERRQYGESQRMSWVCVCGECV